MLHLTDPPMSITASDRSAYGYRVFATDDLIYVGQTIRLRIRLAEH